jgi:hypothetical protein
MNFVVKLLTLLVVNSLGFLAPPAALALSVRMGWLNPSDPTLDVEAFRTHFMHSSYATWAVCALFSLAYLFLKGKERFVFLLAPVIVTFGYGLSVILGFFGA